MRPSSRSSGRFRIGIFIAIALILVPFVPLLTSQQISSYGAVTNLNGNAVPANAAGCLANDGSGTLTWATCGGLTNPMTTAGDTIYGGASGVPTRLAAGTNTQVYIGGTTPSWGSVNLGTMASGNIAVARFNSGTNAGATTVWFGDGTWKLPGATSETVSFSATPTFSTATTYSTITLTGNVTSFTLAAGAAGQEKVLTFCQDATGGRTVAGPANVHGFALKGVTGASLAASTCASQAWNYDTVQTAWITHTGGVINQ